VNRRNLLISHVFVLLMIIHDLNVERIAFRPSEADSPLVVDSNAVLPLPAPRQFLQAIPGWNPQVVELFRSIENQQLPECDSLDVRGNAWRCSSEKELLGIFGRKALYHDLIITRGVMAVKRYYRFFSPAKHRTYLPRRSRRAYLLCQTKAPVPNGY